MALGPSEESNLTPRVKRGSSRVLVRTDPGSPIDDSRYPVRGRLPG